jgi:hypothetical protein
LPERCALPLLRDRWGVHRERGRAAPVRRGLRADTRGPCRSTAAGASTRKRNPTPRLAAIGVGSRAEKRSVTCRLRLCAPARSKVRPT